MGPRIRRPKKTIIAEMSSRIADLEKTLTTQARAGVTAHAAHPPVLAADAQGAAGPSSNRSRPDIIVQKGSSSQYFNEIILSRAIKEVRSHERILRGMW